MKLLIPLTEVCESFDNIEGFSKEPHRMGGSCLVGKELGSFIEIYSASILKFKTEWDFLVLLSL